MVYKGPDISDWQGDIDIKALALQVDFFIFRCYAGSSKDSKVDRNVKLAIECGKPFGLYIYSYALNTEQAKEEAERVVNLANSYSVKPNFLVIDMEDADGYKAKYGMPSNQTLKDICTVEGEIFENAGYYAMVYASSSWWNNQLAGLTRFDKWVAHWPVSAGKQKGNSTSSDGENANNCGLWQFTSQGKLNGYSGNLDMNYGYKEFIIKSYTSNTQISSKKSNQEIAEEVKNGLWGDGDDRKNRLSAVGYDYNAIQSIVNELCKKGVSSKSTMTSTGYYKVVKGDTLSKIGTKYGVDWKKIASLNNISSPYLIYVGQTLKIPNSSNNTNTTISNKYVLGLYVVNTTSGLNVRSGPGTNYGIKKAYPNGTRFDTYEIKGEWARTPSGWVNLKYCKLERKY